MQDLRGRLENRVQLTTDGYGPYMAAVEDNFGGDVDYAMLVKLYGEPQGKSAERKYSPGECCGIKKRKRIGNPVRKDISTSYVERMNLNMRMGCRRFTRLTNAFSKKVENHAHALAIYFAYYNFCRIHQSLRVTPAMEAGLTDHPAWSRLVPLEKGPLPGVEELLPNYQLLCAWPVSQEHPRCEMFRYAA